MHPPDDATALSPTRWTARTGAIEAILKDYSILLDVLDEIHDTTPDEYGLKASGLLHSLKKFDTMFGLSAAESVSTALQRKDLSMQDALDSAKKYYQRIRSQEEFDSFYDKTVARKQ